MRDLLKIYCENAASGPFNVPVIKLGVGRYSHRTYGIIEISEFPVIKWADPATGEVASSPAGKVAVRARAKHAQPVVAELDDDIPF